MTAVTDSYSLHLTALFYGLLDLTVYPLVILHFFPVFFIPVCA